MDNKRRRFLDRGEAGQQLGEKLKKLNTENPCVLAMPRGGVPVAMEIARILRADLDLLLVKRITAPSHPEVAIGAVAEDGTFVWNRRSLDILKLSEEELFAYKQAKLEEIRAQALKWKKNYKRISLRDRTVIVVDDGIATGATMKMAVQVLRKEGVRKIIIAAPVASQRTVESLKKTADQVVVLNSPEDFYAVGQFYDDFTQVGEESIVKALQEFSLMNEEILKDIAQNAHSFREQDELAQWIAKMSQARVVMLGEASHGTEEFYRYRRLISQRLIQDHGFRFIAVEGDWPDCAKLNRYIHQEKTDFNARAVMSSFQRWPTWLWANPESAKLVEWMKGKEAGFYGLDIYSLYESLEVLKNYRGKMPRALAERIHELMECFEPYQKNEVKYAKTVLQNPDKACEKEVIASLQALLSENLQKASFSGEEIFDAQQNALIIANAEKYYQSMLYGGADSWNVRDRHMMETLNRLLDHFGENSRAIVWAHNTHIGDYRATNMVDEGYVNLGGLARERYGKENVYLVGLGTSEGSVLAGQAWGSKPEAMRVSPAAPGSYENYFHRAALAISKRNYFVDFPQNPPVSLLERRGHRAIGVVYQSHYEPAGYNYVPTRLAERYDAFVFLDKTTALKVFEPTQPKAPELLPETWPMGQ